MSMHRKWLVLGGSGQLGRATKSELVSSLTKDEIHTPENLDIRRLNDTYEYITGFKPDYIINCAAWTDVRTAESHEAEACLVNGEAVRNIGLAAGAINATLIHISTDYVFSGVSKKPYNEGDTANPINAYGRSKILGENLLRELEEEKIYILRTAWLYGVHGKNFIKTILRKFLNGEKVIKIVDDQTGNPTNVLDLSRCIIEIAESKSPYGTYHAVNSGSTTWFGFAQKAFETIGLDQNVLYKDITSKGDELKRPKNSSLDTSKWNSSGLTPFRHWEEALESNILEIFNQVGNGK